MTRKRFIYYNEEDFKDFYEMSNEELIEELKDTYQELNKWMESVEIKMDIIEDLKKNIKEIGFKDTIDLMLSSNYEDRFKAEYYQTKIRYNRLHEMIVKYQADTLGFIPTCSIDLLKEQASNMGNYLRILEIRAEIENIKL